VRRLNILGEDNIEKIVKAYREYIEIPGFSKIATIEEIKKERLQPKRNTIRDTQA